MWVSLMFAFPSVGFEIGAWEPHLNQQRHPLNEAAKSEEQGRRCLNDDEHDDDEIDLFWDQERELP